MLIPFYPKTKNLPTSEEVGCVAVCADAGICMPPDIFDAMLSLPMTIRRGGLDGMHKTAVPICADMHRVTGMPGVALPGLTGIRIPFLLLVFHG